MKNLTILSIYFTIACCAANQEIVKKYNDAFKKMLDDCVPETGATNEDIEDVINLRTLTSEGKCLIACFDKQLGIIDDDGIIYRNKAFDSVKGVEEIDQDVYTKLRQVFNICSDREMKSKEKCDVAYEYMICYKEEKIRLGLTDILLPM